MVKNWGYWSRNSLTITSDSYRGYHKKRNPANIHMTFQHQLSRNRVWSYTQPSELNLKSLFKDVMRHLETAPKDRSFRPLSLHGVHSSQTNVCILIPDANHKETGTQFPIFSRLLVLYVIYLFPNHSFNLYVIQHYWLFSNTSVCSWQKRHN